MFVDTRPRGARVLIDGHVGRHDAGARAPDRARPHTVRIEMDGYKPVSTTVD